MNIENNLVLLLEKTQERFVQEKEKEKESRYSSRSKCSEPSSIAAKSASRAKYTEEPESGSMSIDTSQDRSSIYLLEQLAELKELFKSQDELVKKYQEDEVSTSKAKEMQEIAEGSQSPIITDHIFGNSSSGTHPLAESVVASTLIGLNSKQFEKRHKDKVEPFLKFIARSRKSIVFATI